MAAAPDDARGVVLDHDTGMVVGSYRRRPNLLGRAISLATSLVGLGRKGLELPRTLTGSGADPISGEGRPPVTIQDRFGEVEPTTDDLALACPSATGQVVVFVPPPGSDADHWQVGVESTGASYGDRLATLLGWTPVTLRVDQHVTTTDAGMTLAGLMQQVVDHWPVQVERIAVVAEGDGGLVVRRAAGTHALAERPWSDLVSDIVLLGTTPYSAGSRPLTGPIGRRIDAQLGGIAGVEESEQIEPLSATYRLINDRPIPRPTALGQVLGNLLWLRHRMGPAVVELFPTAHRVEVSTGPELANHPEIHSALLTWLR